MMLKGYVILINGQGVVPNKSLEDLFGVIGDWLRFAPNSYCVVCNQTAAYLRGEIRKFLLPTADVLVIASTLQEYDGWVSKVAVDWIEKNHRLLAGAP